jgi:F420-dependent oxidoreductase-like protein
MILALEATFAFRVPRVHPEIMWAKFGALVEARAAQLPSHGSTNGYAVGMQIGLHVPVFAWEGGPEALADHLVNVARGAEDAGFAQITVMDHFFALAPDDGYRLPMLEGYTTLGFIAAATSRIQLGTMVTGVMYRYPGILIKQATTLNVLAKGRAFFGIGAAWFEKEHHAFGVPFPPLKERFERLEETLQLAHQAWRGDSSPFRGKYYQLEEPLLSPTAVSKPRPTILIGGSGEQKTLKLVAQYADACHINAPDLSAHRHKLEVLREHCQQVGRNEAEILKTAGLRPSIAQDGSNANEIVEAVSALGEIGYDLVTMALPDVYNLKAVRVFGERVIPQVASINSREPSVAR